MVSRVRHLLKRHGLPAVEPVLGESQGYANHTYFAGDVVVRLAKADSLESWRAELVAHPYAFAHGIRTPRMIAHGDHYTILERISGRTISPDTSDTFYRDFGQQLARLHRLPPPPDPRGHLGVHEPPSIRLELIPSALRDLAVELASEADDTARDFIHGDLNRSNILETPDGKAVLLDWGDSGYGHRAYEFADLPFEKLELCLAAYVEEGGLVDGGFRRRLAALILGRAHHRSDLVEGAALLFKLAGHPGEAPAPQ